MILGATAPPEGHAARCLIKHRALGAGGARDNDMVAKILTTCVYLAGIAWSVLVMGLFVLAMLGSKSTAVELSAAAIGTFALAFGASVVWLATRIIGEFRDG